MESQVRILVVDEDIEFRSLLGKTLTREGFFVQTASCHEDAATLLDAGERFELLLTGLRVGSICGGEMARQMAEANPDLRIVLMIAYGEQSRVKDLLEGGARYVSRPFKIPELLDVIDEVLEPSGEAKGINR